MLHFSPIRRRSLTAVAALLASGVAGPWVKAHAGSKGGQVAIAVAGKAAFPDLPLVIAEQLGYFKAEGLAVTIIDHPDEAAAFQTLGAGGADVVCCAFQHIISRPGRVQSIVLLDRTPQVAMGVSTRTLPGLRSHAELRGRRIGVSAPNSSSHTVARMVLRRAGLAPGDVTFVGVGMGAGALQALRAGQIDAISNVEPVMSALEQKAEIKIIADTRNLQGALEVLGGPMAAGCLCAPVDFVRTHPEICQALADAIVHSLKWVRTAGPGDILRTVPDSYVLGDRSLYLTAFQKVVQAFSLDGLMTTESSQTALRVMSELDPALATSHLNLAQTYTNVFAMRAKERFKA